MIISKLKLILTLTLISASSFAYCGEKMAVFMQREIDASAILKSFQDAGQLSQIEVTVFAKYRDFDSVKQQTNFDYAILPSSYQLFNSDYTPVLQFTHSGESHFQFLILSLGGQWTADNLKEGVIGVIDEMDRKDTKSYLTKLLGDNSYARVTRVTKSRDLIPLLYLHNADYVITPPDDSIVEGQGSLKIVRKSTRVLNPLLYINAKKSKTSAHIVKELSQMPPAVLKALGFDGIEPLKEGL